MITDAQFAALVGGALRDELGGSHRAAKTIMAWTSVSDHTARAWLHGRKSPSSLHLLALAAHSRLVMSVVLRLTGYDGLALNIDIGALESGLEEILSALRLLRRPPGPPVFD
ncbi:hypothetical protein FHS95_002848 [Sphingomonas naasensis]|uniref:XRE family transcriptional regulator n=1 Tax=Sphingomonas naasensis TaxID=1344951 RepID=A0A4V3QVD4_9SPHN|nr:hypothetical protein [Sphingomonas naasensis]NIJ21145.1 hypothetical protein [Sphingomonas naasensis]TGX38272.1 hypothetical protein E5A74_18790 [Sphingomonas naasensis]